MKTTTGAMLTALGRTITEPGLFVRLGFSTPLYLTDRDTRTWNSQSWTSAAISLSDVTVANGILQTCTLEIVDATNAIATLLLSQNAPDLKAKIWYFDAAATATGDPVLLDEYQLDNPDGGDSRVVRIPLALINRSLPVGMLAQLLPAYMFATEGRPIRWGAGTIIPERRQAFN